MLNTMKKMMALLLALVMVLSLSAAAFAAEAEEAETETAEAGEEDLSAYDKIGEETDTARFVKLTNMTGTDIMGLNIRKSGDWQFSDELMADDDLFEKEETSLFFYESEAAEEAGEEAEAAETEAEGEAEEAEPVLYDIQIVWSDWTVGVLYNIELDDLDEADIQRSWNSLPYLTYKSLASEEDVNTEEAEQTAYFSSPEYAAYGGGGSSSSSSGGSSSGGSSSGGSGWSYGGDSGCIDNGLLW